MNTKSENSPIRSQIGRLAAVAAVGVGVLVLGHYVGRLMGRSDVMGGPDRAATAPMKMQTSDAGRDAPDVPPPPGSERIFTLTSPGRRYDVMVRYASDAAVEELARFYRRRMPRAGWRERRDLAASQYPGVLLSYSKTSGDSCIISISDLNGRSYVSVLRRRAHGRP